MIIGGKYNWKNQPERLTFIGRNWRGNGFWNQFEKEDEPGIVWCEVLDSDLHMIEKTESMDCGRSRLPDCPMHGTEAQRTRANTEDHIAQLQERISQLEESVSLQEEIICSLTRQVAQIVDNL